MIWKKIRNMMTLIGENEKIANVKTAWIVDNKTKKLDYQVLV